MHDEPTYDRCLADRREAGDEESPIWRRLRPFLSVSGTARLEEKRGAARFSCTGARADR